MPYTSSGLGGSAVNVVVGAGAVGGGLAASGAESWLLAVISAGLIFLGAFALRIRMRGRSASTH